MPPVRSVSFADGVLTLVDDRGTIGGRAYASGQQPQKSRKITTRRHGDQRPRVAVARGAGGTALKG